MRRSAPRKSFRSWGTFPSWEPSSDPGTTEGRRPSSFSSSLRRSSPAWNPSAWPGPERENKRKSKKRRKKRRTGLRKNDRRRHDRRRPDPSRPDRRRHDRIETEKGQVGGPDRCGRPWPARRWWGDRLLHLHKARPHAPGASNGLYRRADDGQKARSADGDRKSTRLNSSH